MTQNEKIIAQLRAIGKNDALAVIKEWAVSRHRTEQDHTAVLAKSGFELVDVPKGSTSVGELALTRPIVWIGSKAYALRPDVFLEQRKAAMAEAVEEKRSHGVASQPSPGEGLAAVLCPACYSTMSKAPICPNCSKGKAGFKILCQCTECSYEVYL
jgi:hypothetical protein